MHTRIELVAASGTDVAPVDSAAPAAVLALRGPLTDATAADLAARLATFLRDHPRVVIDLAGLTVEHPDAVHAFTDAVAQSGEWPDVRAVLATPDPALTALLVRAQVAHRIPLQPDIIAALAHVDDRPARTCALWHLSVTPRAPGTARGHVRRVCTRWDVDDDTREAAEIVVTELVTNAVEHAASPTVVEVERSDGSFRLTVRDFDTSALPDGHLPELSSIRGRGLAIVAAVTRAWGVENHGDGKTVWAEMNARPPLA